MSYDEILKTMELEVIIPKLKDMLNRMNAAMPELDKKYAGTELLRTCLKDLDIYINIGRALLKETEKSYYPENSETFKDILSRIASLSPSTIQLFSSSGRDLDFSQYKVRGHYTDTYYPALADYFRAMIWFGRTEIYLTSPKAVTQQQITDLQRQIIDAFLVKELLTLSGTTDKYNDINKVIESFVGEQDNVTIDNLNTMASKLAITDITAFSDTSFVSNFRTELSKEPFSDQKILSQILMTGPGGPPIKPASAFLLFGQRFIADSYIFSQVVFSNIEYEGRLVPRMLPSSLDILFAIGNNGAGKLLENEIKEFKYSSNLNSLRYLINSYGDDFWNKSLYNIWLNSIRDLNPQPDLTKFPQSMQTAAYWQSKMTSQLASWAQLRHDNLLYAKQSYSGGIICSFPFSYVDPFPAFYQRIVSFAEKTITILSEMNYVNNRMTSYLNHLKSVCEKLKIISEKELDKTALSVEEKKFLSEMMRINQGCGAEYDGWYPNLFYKGESSFKKTDLIIADVHTAPTDKDGNFVGWVKHAATGKLNMAIVIAPNYDGEQTAFIGPVLSYHDYTTQGFLRLSDEEWTEIYNKGNMQTPAFSNLYMTGATGEKKENGPTLLALRPVNDQPVTHLLLKNFPNPFNPSTNICFSIPDNSNLQNVTLSIYDISGRLVRNLLNENLPGGNYIIQWNGKDEAGKKSATGVYICHLRSGSKNISLKINLVK